MVSLEELQEILESVKTIAVVGASAKEEKASNSIPAYLQSQGYRIIPVNPHEDEIFGEKVYRSLAEIPDEIDMVEVFRPPAEAEAVARAAIDAKAKVLWFQPGTGTRAAEDMAAAAGLRVVDEACAGVVHRLINKATVR